MRSPRLASQSGLSGHLDTIERITGIRPATCPWRAYYDPVVREVMRVAWAIDEGNLAVELGADPDAVIVDAIAIYRMAYQATLAEERRVADEERKRKQTNT